MISLETQPGTKVFVIKDNGNKFVIIQGTLIGPYGDQYERPIYRNVSGHCHHQSNVFATEKEAREAIIERLSLEIHNNLETMDDLDKRNMTISIEIKKQRELIAKSVTQNQ